ncbi:uncharacterized protein LOC141518892 [Macrotis lagotis]|uniref:uncharacterized protein LOC141518892 n=1 Tax=Macrotis lagotis TaxID=92651 RepID=UPI003D683045
MGARPFLCRVPQAGGRPAPPRAPSSQWLCEVSAAGGAAASAGPLPPRRPYLTESPWKPCPPEGRRRLPLRSPLPRQRRPETSASRGSPAPRRGPAFVGRWGRGRPGNGARRLERRPARGAGPAGSRGGAEIGPAPWRPATRGQSNGRAGVAVATRILGSRPPPGPPPTRAPFEPQLPALKVGPGARAAPACQPGGPLDLSFPSCRMSPARPLLVCPVPPGPVERQQGVAPLPSVQGWICLLTRNRPRETVLEPELLTPWIITLCSFVLSSLRVSEHPAVSWSPCLSLLASFAGSSSRSLQLQDRSLKGATL